MSDPLSSFPNTNPNHCLNNNRNPFLVFTLALELDKGPALEVFSAGGAVLTSVFDVFRSRLCRIRSHVKRLIRNHVIDELYASRRATKNVLSVKGTSFVSKLGFSSMFITQGSWERGIRMMVAIAPAVRPAKPSISLEVSPCDVHNPTKANDD